MMNNEQLMSVFYNEICKRYSNIQLIEIEPSEMIFEERVKMNCFYCGKYNLNWRCPPKIPSIDYKKMFSEYKSGALVCLTLPFDKDTYSQIRNDSSVMLHKALLDMEKILWNNNFSMAISFIGGSCKLCKNGCGKERCNNPYLSRTPLEATGVNVVASAKKYGIDIVFPPIENMIRLGLILW